MLKSSLLDVILSTSGAKARKCSNRASWSSFCRLLKPKLENAQIEPPGRHFVDFCSKGAKVVKSSLLDVILSTSGANARKWDHLRSSFPGIIWDHLGSAGVIWGHLGSSGIIWGHLGSSGALGSFWEQLLQYL